MSYEWEVKLEVWPFSGVVSSVFPKLGITGDEGDQKLAGPKERTFKVEGPDLRHALAAAELVVRGIKSSGHVWEAPIMSITRKREGQ